MRRLALVALLVAALVAAAADPGFARPDGPVTRSATKTVKKQAKKKIACKQRKTRAARRRCLAAKRRAAVRKKPAVESPSASAPSGTTAPGTTAPASPTPTSDDDPYGHEVPDLPPSNPRALQVISGEFFLTLSKAEVLAGNVRVEFNNAYAEDPHDLHLIRGQQSYSFGELESGEVEAKTLNLEAGTWQLLCALPEHAQRGMTANLKVSSG